MAKKPSKSETAGNDARDEQNTDAGTGSPASEQTGAASPDVSPSASIAAGIGMIAGGASEASLEVAPANEHDFVRLRSRHRRYRVKNVRFEGYVATVTSLTAHELSRLPEFGPGKQFWIDEVAA